jgi:hypothetical protein
MRRLHDLDLLPFEQPEEWVGDDLVGCGEPGRHLRLEAEIAADRDVLQVDVLPVVQRRHLHPLCAEQHRQAGTLAASSHPSRS